MDKEKISQLISFDEEPESIASQQYQGNKIWEIIKPSLHEETYHRKIHLDEGLVITYPLETVLRKMRSMYTPEEGIQFGTYRNQDDTNTIEGNKYLVCGIRKSKIDAFMEDFTIPEINKILSRCGYTFIKRAEDLKGTLILYYAPKYTGDMTKYVFDTPYKLLHISLSYNREIILKQGLLPRSGNMRYKYPPRVHLFYPYGTHNSEQRLVALMNDLYETLKYEPSDTRDSYDTMLMFMLLNYQADLKNTMDDIQYNGKTPKEIWEHLPKDFTLDVYEIDKTKLIRPDDIDEDVVIPIKSGNELKQRVRTQGKGNNSGIHFFKDPSFADGIYTYDRIPPETLSFFLKDFSVDDLDNIIWNWKGLVDWNKKG